MAPEGNDGMSEQSRQVVEEAWRLHRAGDLAAARTLYVAVLDRAPETPEALHRLGILAYQEGETSVALDLLDRAMRLRPDHCGQWRHRGAALMALGHFGEAAESFRRALSLEPGDAETIFNLGLTERRLGNLLNAIPLLEAAASALGSYAVIQYELALAYQLAGHRATALDGYRRTLTLDPGHANALNNQGVLLQEGATSMRRRRLIGLRSKSCRTLFPRSTICVRF